MSLFEVLYDRKFWRGIYFGRLAALKSLAHGLVKFRAHSISHFLMNILMAKTGSTTKVNSAE